MGLQTWGGPQTGGGAGSLTLLSACQSNLLGTPGPTIHSLEQFGNESKENREYAKLYLPRRSWLTTVGKLV